MQDLGRRDFMDIGAFHYTHLVKSILLLAQWIDILVYIYTCLLQWYHELGIKLSPILFLSAGWTLAGAAEPVSVVIIVAYFAR